MNTFKMQIADRVSRTPEGGFCIVFNRAISLAFSVSSASMEALSAGIATLSFCSHSSCKDKEKRNIVYGHILIFLAFKNDVTICSARLNT